MNRHIDSYWIPQANEPNTLIIVFEIAPMAMAAEVVKVHRIVPGSLPSPATSQGVCSRWTAARGKPIISSIYDLVPTGQRIQQIQSGYTSFAKFFECFSQSTPSSGKSLGNSFAKWSTRFNMIPYMIQPHLTIVLFITNYEFKFNNYDVIYFHMISSTKKIVINNKCLYRSTAATWHC